MGSRRGVEMVATFGEQSPPRTAAHVHSTVELAEVVVDVAHTSPPNTRSTLVENALHPCAAEVAPPRPADVNE